MATTLRATTFRDSDKSFREALDAHGIKYNRRIQLSDAVMASGMTIEIIIELSGGWGALAVACLAWARARASRKITITTKDMKAVWLEGYSAEQAAKLLESAQQLAAIDTEAAKDETQQSVPADVPASRGRG